MNNHPTVTFIFSYDNENKEIAIFKSEGIANVVGYCGEDLALKFTSEEADALFYKLHDLSDANCVNGMCTAFWHRFHVFLARFEDDFGDPEVELSVIIKKEN